MSNRKSPIKDDQSSIIRQGFLCPECKMQLSNITDLENHFGSVHSNQSNNNLGNHFNKFLGKAKKILKTESRNDLVADSNELDKSADLLPITTRPKFKESECYYSLRKDQTIGYSKDHYNDYFKKIRDSKIERDVLETNKLLIRIDQLLQDLPSNPEKRRAHEMSVVIWANDDDVRLCPYCAKSFNISRRRHHCRLCGAVMCNDCSLFLDLDYAKKLINPVDLDGIHLNNVLTVKDNSSQDSNLNVVSKNNVKRTSTQSLLKLGKNLTNNLANINLSNKDTNEYQIKACKECKILLDKRMQQITDQHVRPILKTYYEKLKNLQLESDNLVPLYVQMCRSLRAGETIYNLEDAQLLRIKLMKLGDAMDSLSKQILALNFEEGNDFQSLRNKLRLFVAQYLQRNLLGLPSLPYEYELKELQERRHNEIKLALESGCNNLEDNDHLRVNKSDRSQNTNEIVSTDNGWNMEKLELKDEDEDPILLQINIIKKYIEQARLDHKYDEVNLLESNLKSLEIEYFLQENDKQTTQTAIVDDS